jgi:nucleotide-binding universal stress UspA family protein
MIKDVMVHLERTEADEIRLQHAERIATLFGSRVTGLFVNAIPEPFLPADVGGAGVEILAEVARQAKEEGDRAENALRERLTRLSVPSEVRRLDLFPGEIPVKISAEARWADLFVALRPYGGSGSEPWPQIAEAVLFGSGRALYLAPKGSQATGDFARILIAWNNSREATRAVLEAMPFLQRASEVVVVLADEDSRPEERGLEPGADLARHLLRNGVTVTLRNIASRPRDTAERLIDEAQRMAADLIVMGSYGHSRFREWVLGGVTRGMLHLSPLPLLVAH